MHRNTIWSTGKKSWPTTGVLSEKRASMECRACPEVPALEPPANAPEQTTMKTDGAPGGVVVSAEQIEKLMAERNAAARAEVEKKEPPEPEQSPAPAPEEKTTEDKMPAPEETPKGRCGRKSKEEKAESAAPKGTGPRRDRPPKDGKAAPDKALSPPRDKMSQSKGGRKMRIMPAFCLDRRSYIS